MNRTIFHHLSAILFTLLICLSMNVMADEVITFTGSASDDIMVFDKVNSPAIYFTSPASKTGATKLVLKSIQVYTFLDASGNSSNLEGKTVYMGLSTTKPSGITTGGTGGSHTANSGIEILGFSEGVTYNSEGYTTFTFNNLEINPNTEYALYLTRENTAMTGFTYYNYRFRVYQESSNNRVVYYGQSGNQNLMKWMPFYIVTLTDKEEDVTTSIPNPAMTEEEIQQAFEDYESSPGTSGTGSTSTRSAYGFGFTMPNGNGVSKYTTNKISVYRAYNRSYRGNYYLVIAKSNLADATLSKDDIIAVSSNYVSMTTTSTAGYKDYNFSTNLEFRPNTTYYAYFSTNNTTDSNKPEACYIGTKTSTYYPTIYTGSTPAAVTTYWPLFKMDLTKNTSNIPYTDGELQTLWSSYNNAHPWRIPALAHTKNGNLVAFGGYLICNADVGNGECHIVSKVSTDNGVTWSSAGAMVATGSGISGADDCGYGDAAVVADRESDRILVMCATGNVVYGNSTREKPIRVARIYGTESSSGKITWESPTDVTQAIYDLTTDITRAFFSSGRICQSRAIKVGDYYRLYSALTTNAGNYVVYSDDFGETWKLLGGVAAPNGDEAKIEEMPNGDVFISSRKGSGRYLNLFTYTDKENAEGAWGTQQNLSLGAGNPTNGEILFVNVVDKNGKNCILALQSIPSVAGSSSYSRRKVKIYWREMSQDDLSDVTKWTSGWSDANSYLVSGSGSGYSTMVVTPENKIGFMLENHYVNVGPRCDLQYVNLPISMITNNNYTEIISEYNLPYRTSYSEMIAKNKTDMRFDKVTLNRADVNDTERYYTFCSPFDLTPEEISDAGITSVETLSRYNAEKEFVKFEDVTDGIKAFQPYVIKGSKLEISKDYQLILKEQPVLEDVVADDAIFRPNLEEPLNINPDGATNAFGYSAKTGKFVKAKQNATLHAYCAYIILPKSATAKELSIGFAEDDNTATGIQTLEQHERLVTVYNLSGQKVFDNVPTVQLKSLPKGIYVVNNKKQVIK